MSSRIFPRLFLFFKPSRGFWRNRLLLFAAKGDLINFRLLLNRRKHHLKNLPLRENDADSELGVALTDTTQSPESPGETTEVGALKRLPLMLEVHGWLTHADMADIVI